ncbi:ribosome maturation factor RimP [bacterium]|nr:ribosome maturation factor RimP [bacterium]MBU1072259.1 ribosome maturation factor RimP [bacterium]MBU1676055.1 ribosome maturation factor RimP [bacterium]
MNRYELSARVIGLLEDPLAELGFELLDVRIYQGGGRLTLRVYLDTENGVSADDCARASRTVGMLLEETDLVADAYLIEVTSPGVRRPLRTPAHFRGAVGQDVILKVFAAKGARSLKGRLLEAGDTELVLEPAAAAEQSGAETDAKVLHLKMDEIREANLDPDFDVQALINADRRRRKQDKKQAREQRREQRRRPRKS